MPLPFFPRLVKIPCVRLTIMKPHENVICCSLRRVSGNPAMSAFEERAAAGPPWSSDGWKYFEEACDIIVRKCGVLQLAVDQEVRVVTRVSPFPPAEEVRSSVLWILLFNSGVVATRSKNWTPLLMISSRIAERCACHVSCCCSFTLCCAQIWDLRTALEQATAEVYWEEVIEDDFNCDLEGDTTQATSVRDARCVRHPSLVVVSCVRFAAGTTAGVPVRRVLAGCIWPQLSAHG